MNVDDIANYPNLATELQLVQDALDRNISILGICLGAQLLAKALGGSVHRAPAPEIGWHDVDVNADGQSDCVLSGFGARSQVFQWHEDNIELPSNVVHLASSPKCAAQAFRCGEHAYGFQFHLEANKPLIERWLNVPDHQADLDAGRDVVDPDRIRAKMSQSVGPLRALSQQTFARWIDRFDLTPRRRTLASR